MLGRSNGVHFLNRRRRIIRQKGKSERKDLLMTVFLKGMTFGKESVKDIVDSTLLLPMKCSVGDDDDCSGLQ